MSSKLALWLCVLHVVVVLTAVGKENEDHELVVDFIVEELQKPSITSIRVKDLVNVLVIIHGDAKEGNSKRVEDLARFLRNGLHEDFHKYVHTLIENQEGKTVQLNDEVFAKTIQAITEKNFAQAALTSSNGKEYNSQQTSFFEAMMALYRKMPIKDFLHILSLLKNLKDAYSQLSKDLVDESSFGQFAKRVLMDVSLAYDVLANMERWWHNEISGQRCAKNILESLGTTMGAASGAAVGKFIGSACFGPIGAVMGSWGGAVLGAKTAELFMQRLTQELFDLPKSEAEENAYNFFGLNKNASDSEINAAFRRESQKYHPDNRKTGDHKKFFRVNVHMQVLRMARRERSGTGSGCYLSPDKLKQIIYCHSR